MTTIVTQKEIGTDNRISFDRGLVGNCGTMAVRSISLEGWDKPTQSTEELVQLAAEGLIKKAFDGRCNCIMAITPDPQNAANESDANRTAVHVYDVMRALQKHPKIKMREPERFFNRNSNNWNYVFNGFVKVSEYKSELRDYQLEYCNDYK